MITDTLKTMRSQLVSCVQGQLGDISRADSHELGQAVDMIKDFSQAIYYCTITDSMEKAEKENQQTPVNNINYYTTPEYRNMQRAGGYMYYPASNGGQNTGTMSYYSSGSNGGGSNGSVSYYTDMKRDPRQGRSPMRRRMYMEGKEMHKDTNSQLKELEAYLQELSTDITEMIKDASPEERSTLRQKMTTLASKIA